MQGQWLRTISWQAVVCYLEDVLTDEESAEGPRTQSRVIIDVKHVSNDIFGCLDDVCLTEMVFSLDVEDTGWLAIDVAEIILVHFSLATFGRSSIILSPVLLRVGGLASGRNGGKRSALVVSVDTRETWSLRSHDCSSAAHTVTAQERRRSKG